MAKNQKKVLAKKKKREVRRRRERVKVRANRPSKPSIKVQIRLAEADELIDEGRFQDAERILDDIAKRDSHIPDLIRTQIYLYQELGHHEKICLATKRLSKLVPNDPESVMMHAQASLFCGRASIALRGYREFVNRWPDHENASKARAAIEICEPECISRLARAQESGFTSLRLEDGGLELFATHEESLEQLRAGNFEAAIELCNKVLETEPGFLSARNNLATCCFQSGHLDQTIETARETYCLAPNNRYAQSNLAKYEFLTGNPEAANTIANKIVSDPPLEQDPLVAAMEALSYLGRDEDVVAMGNVIRKIPKMDDDVKAIGLHHFAVAVYRLGDEKLARKIWSDCLRKMPSHGEAMKNLDDLNSGDGHAAWADPMSKWIPESVADAFTDIIDESPTQRIIDDCVFLSLVPAMLDRGDPLAREFALRIAMLVESQPMLDAIKEFAFGHRGPNDLRHRAMMFLYDNDVITAGPHRFFSYGKWTEVSLFAPEVVYEPIKSVEPWQQELAEIGFNAQQDGNYEKAEKAWMQVLERAPDDPSAAFNLAVVWLNRDGIAGRNRAFAKFQELHKDHPDYLFASIALANIAAKDGNFDRAGELLGNAMQQERLHVSEATALFVCQIQIALEKGEPGAAEMAYGVLVDLVGEDHPAAIQSRQLIDAPVSLIQRLGKKLSPFHSH